VRAILAGSADALLAHVDVDVFRWHPSGEGNRLG
jgi:hypothetical protein